VEQVVDALLRRLTHKGVSPDEVPWLIRDVLNVLAEAGELALNAVNRRLAALGWDEEILDKVTFELIIYLVEEHEEDHPRSPYVAARGDP
jgi:hypothetical protein